MVFNDNRMPTERESNESFKVPNKQRRKAVMLLIEQTLIFFTFASKQIVT